MHTPAGLTHTTSRIKVFKLRYSNTGIILKFQVLLKFTRMNIEEDHPCDDYVQVYSMDCEDIKSSNGRQYDVYDQSGRLCYYHMTNQNNGTFPISKPCAYVEFRSDFWDQESGFDLSYAFLTV